METVRMVPPPAVRGLERLPEHRRAGDAWHGSGGRRAAVTRNARAGEQELHEQRKREEDGGGKAASVHGGPDLSGSAKTEAFE